VRTLLLVGAIALLFVAGLLYVFRGALRGQERSSRPPPAAPVDPAPAAATEEGVPHVADRLRRFQRAPEAQRLLLEFVRACAEHGAAAVPELALRLRNEPDVEIEPRWSFENGRVRGFPSLRSAYIAALLAIPGPEARDALLAALELTASPEEAYQIAAGLADRGEGGFTATAIARATKAAAGDLEVARDLVALVVRADPEGAAAEILAQSPRGANGADPALLAHGLEVLPLERATATAKGLVADPGVTPKAKERYLRSLCDRGEPEILATLRELAQDGKLDRELRLAAAYGAVGSRAFYLDQAAYAIAAAGGEGPPPAEIRERYERRLAEATLLIEAAVQADVGASTQVLESLRRRLEDQRARLR
jgi:hypothetical protein